MNTSYARGYLRSMSEYEGGPDPDADPEMKESGAEQQDQAEGEDDPAET